MLACPRCNDLVHRQEYDWLASQAKEAESKGDWASALASWRQAMGLLPEGMPQRLTVQRHMAGLRLFIDQEMARSSPKEGTAKKSALTGLGLFGLLLLKFKPVLSLVVGNGKLLLLGLTKLPTLLSMLVYARWVGGGGWMVGLGIAGCIYVHEVGHVAALRRYGIESSAPMFVPGFGAFVRLKQIPADAQEDARIGLAGPLWGLAAAMAAALVGLVMGWPTAVRVGAWAGTVNLFNLIPVWQLDGARGFRALSEPQRCAVAAVALATAVLSRQWMPGIVGVVALVRAFRKEAPSSGDEPTQRLFLSLVVSLTAVAALSNFF